MQSGAVYLFVADIILFTHVLFVAFVVIGLVLIYIGKARAWYWVRNPWFRLAHLLAIGVVALQSWLGARCPFTIWEMSFRERAGGATYPGDFISHWLGEILYYRAPEWVFVLIYTAFALLVVVSWFYIRPRSFAGDSRHRGN